MTALKRYTHSENWLSFDGKSNWVGMPLEKRTVDALTVAAWVWVNKADNMKVVTDFISADDDGFTLGLGFDKELDENHVRLNPSVGDGARRTFSAGSIELREWTFVAMTWQKDGQLKGYVGTSPETLMEVHNIPAGSSPVKLGNHPYPAIGKQDHSQNSQVDWLTGVILHVAIWNQARTLTDFQNDMEGIKDPDKSLIGYWPMNEGFGTKLWDHSGCGQHGTWNGGSDGDSQWAQPLVIIQITPNPRATSNDDAYIFPKRFTVHPDDTVYWWFGSDIDKLHDDEVKLNDPDRIFDQTLQEPENGTWTDHVGPNPQHKEATYEVWAGDPAKLIDPSTTGAGVRTTLTNTPGPNCSCFPQDPPEEVIMEILQYIKDIRTKQPDPALNKAVEKAGKQFNLSFTKLDFKRWKSKYG